VRPKYAPGTDIGDILSGRAKKSTTGGGNVPIEGEYDGGGVVGGPRGSAQLIVAHGGETILPTHKPGGAAARGGTTINIVVNSTAPADQVVQVIRDTIRREGARALGLPA